MQYDLYKPWQLAKLERISSQDRLVEIVSYPIPPGFDSAVETIMVRMVPGFPDTIQEVDMANIRPTIEPYRYIHVTEVTVHLGTFPKDMLRYDNATLFDDRQSEDDYRPIGPVLIYRLTIKDKKPNWTIDRWNSFMCTLKKIETINLKNQQH